ncbi:MAG: tRNA dihydrouridine(20/20a) synthase DusA [Gammaproteobacteria bacterium]|nr:MAG: tRNA dihydrouridine(20/20a) synthase DusA [Gammaproteobacteria bacterium]
MIHGCGPLGTRGSHRLCVAPMMDCTDRHARTFLRSFGPDIVLYTEMVTAAALLHGNRERLLAFDPCEHPVALQLGGNDPRELARAARMGAEAGFDEINLNVGCPSDRVRSGRFGACLMREPERVADCIAAMREQVSVPVTVKCRLGVDDHDSKEHLHGFVDRVADAGCTLFIIHARKAILGGLSPKENREIPPLQYHRVHALAAHRRDLEIVINGGLKTVTDAERELRHTHGVMLGREAYGRPEVLGTLADALLPSDRDAVTGADAITAYRPYLAARLAEGVPLHAMTRHLLGLFSGRPGARQFRRILSEQGCRDGAGIEVLDRALAAVDPTLARAA